MNDPVPRVSFRLDTLPSQAASLIKASTLRGGRQPPHGQPSSAPSLCWTLPWAGLSFPSHPGLVERLPLLGVGALSSASTSRSPFFLGLPCALRGGKGPGHLACGSYGSRLFLGEPWLGWWPPRKSPFGGLHGSPSQFPTQAGSINHPGWLYSPYPTPDPPAPALRPTEASFPAGPAQESGRAPLHPPNMPLRRALGSWG